jgi:hypothetical protein
MSVVTRILTGLSEHEWKEAWAKVEPVLPKLVGVCIPELVTFEEWMSAVCAEGRNRQFISYATTGKRCSFRAGVRQVVSEILADASKVSA